MIFTEVYDKLEKLAPLKYALERDNTGFQVGRSDKVIKKVLVATDATFDVVEQGISGKADLILTHHPLIYDPLSKIINDDIIGRRVLDLIRNDINYMSMHTNFDVMVMADLAADKLGIKEKQIFYPTYYEGDELKEGIGRYGIVDGRKTVNEYAEKVKSEFNLDSVQVYGERDRVVNTIAVSPGSSSDLLKYAISTGVELLITGDIKYNMALEALAHGISLIDAGHYGTEKIFVPFMKEFFEREMSEIEVFVANECNPFYVV